MDSGHEAPVQWSNISSLLHLLFIYLICGAQHSHGTHVAVRFLTFDEFIHNLLWCVLFIVSWCKLGSSFTYKSSAILQVWMMDPYSLITFNYEWWPCHQASGVCLPRAIIHPTRVWILSRPCDYTGGVITHHAHHELKRIMRFVNKRQPFWQQLTHLPPSLVSFDRCVWGGMCTCRRLLYVCVLWAHFKATIDEVKEQVSNKDAPLILF